MSARKGLYTKILVDDSSGSPTDISEQVTETEGIPLAYDEIEVGGFSNAVKSYVSGRADGPVTLKGSLSATVHAIFTSWVGDDTDVRTVEFRYGNNAAPTTGDPQIDGEYICTSYKVTSELDGKQMFEAKLAVAAGQSLPAWGTV
jgi:hypothetical protein